MYDLKGCRACLNHNCKLERINDSTKRIYCINTGLDFTQGDCYPSYFCTECYTLLKKILAFRRRCRRAFFVLKEIVAVRQKVTLADLSIVDRKKTNLTSSIGYWKNNNTGFYSINEDEATDANPSNIRNFIKEFEPTSQGDTGPYTDVNTTKYIPEVINHTYIAVDIKPDNCEEANNDFFQKTEYLSDGDIDINDDMRGNEPADDNDAKIDLEDVFKGLPEEKCDEDSDYGLPELPESAPDPTPKPIPEIKIRPKILSVDKVVTNDNKNVCRMELKKAFMLSRNLLDFTIHLLPFEEQIDTFHARKDTEPYKSAAFKCSMCLTIFPGMPELLKHVHLHNSKQVVDSVHNDQMVVDETTARALNQTTLLNDPAILYQRKQPPSQGQRNKYMCTICKDVFGSQAELTAHSACYHWYKYHCKECQADKFTLFDTLKCHNKPPVSTSKYFSMGELFNMSDMTSVAPLAPMEKTCRYCVKRVNGGQRKLEEHERSHVESPKTKQERYRYQCDVCAVWCKLKVQLESHMHTHYRTFSCKRCDKVFQGWVAAHNHLKEHKMFTCTCCKQTFGSDLEKRKHQAKHRSESNLDCNLCGIPIYSLGKLYYHQLAIHGYISINHSSLGDPNYRCGACGIQFVDEASLNTHQAKRGHVEPEKLGGKCDSCRKVFFTVEEFVAHRRGNKVCKRYPVKCVYCDVMLENFRQSERHYEHAHPSLPNVHQDAMLYTICEFCGKSIVQQHIKQHTKRHTTPGGEPVLACRFCGHKVFTSRAYVSHVLFNHTPRPYMCAQCPCRFKYRSECREHILKIHAPELLYSCQLCTRRFSHLDLLQEHSVKAHGVSAKHDRSVYMDLKDVSGKIYVFPHMKIDGSFIPPAVIEDAGLYLYDYLCKSHKVVDWKDYYVFDTGLEPTAADPYAHRKRPARLKKPKDTKQRRKPVDEKVVKAVESQSFMEVLPEQRKRRQYKRRHNSESGVAHDKTKIAKVDEEPTLYDGMDMDNIDNVEHEEMIQEYDVPDLQVAILGEPSEAKSYDHEEKPKKKSYRKRERMKLSERVDEVIRGDESQSVDDVEREEMDRGHDMPDLHATVLESPSNVIKDGNKEETVEEEYEEVDMGQDYQVVEENGEQYVMMNGNLYRLQLDL